MFVDNTRPSSDYYYSLDNRTVCFHNYYLLCSFLPTHLNYNQLDGLLIDTSKEERLLHSDMDVDKRLLV